MKTLKNFFSAVAFISCQALMAAPAPPPGGTTGSTPVCWPPPCVPIDNGILFLMAAGVLFAAKKIYDLHKKAQTQS